jgi:hypothetical protein
MKVPTVPANMFALFLCLVCPQIGATCNNFCKERRVFETCRVENGFAAGSLIIYQEKTCARCVGNNACEGFFGSAWSCEFAGHTKRANSIWLHAPLCTCTVGLRNVQSGVMQASHIDDANYFQNVSRFTCTGWPTPVVAVYDDEDIR